MEKKRAKVDEDELMDPKVVETISKLQEVQDELEKINEEASDKVLEIEQKYNEIRRPVYIKRGEIISTIPDFWLTSFLSHPVLFSYLSDEDQEVFKFLHSINVEDFSDVKSGFSITFNFKENPYFENDELKKVFKFSEEGNVSIEATKIKWKKDMDLTNGKIEEEDEKGSKRHLPKEESFFKWFESFEDTKSAFDNLQDEVADMIKDDLWPNPLKYFAQEGEEDDIEFEEDEEDEDEDEDEDEENEDEEDEKEDTK